LGRIGWCVLIVVAMHVSLLAVPARSAAPRTEAQGNGQAVQLRAVHLAPLSDAREATESTLPPSRLPAPQSAKANAASNSARAASGRTDDSPASVDVADPSPRLPDLGLYAWSANPLDDYYPRTELTVGPAPQGSVQIEYPAFDGERELYVSELLLLIDEAGVVSSVLLVGPPLPAPLEDAARAAFLQVPFRPGERDGRPVKSRIRVEVVFDRRHITS
jgi:hypothetical protein